MTTNKDYEVFAREYKKEEKEILVLTSDASSGAGRSKGETLWSASKFFLAYYDLNSSELKEGEGRLNWPITEEERQENGVDWPYHFKGGKIYHIVVRELIDKTVPDGMLPSFFNRFLVVKVLEEDVHNEMLNAILAEYRKPVVMADEVLGEFELNKDMDYFEGKVNWLGEKIFVLLEVSRSDKGTWTKAMNVLRTLYEEQKERDLQFRTFAADQLTDLAGDWQQEEDAPEITKQNFIDRINISELSVSSDGSFTAFYDDDDMFWGHIITVYGSLSKGLESANIEG